MNEVSRLNTYTTLFDALEDNRDADRSVTYIEGESSHNSSALVYSPG